MFDSNPEASNIPLEFSKEELEFAPTQSEYDSMIKDVMESGRPFTAPEFRKLQAFRQTWQYFWNRKELDRERV